MEDLFKESAGWIALCIEAVGVLVIAGGSLQATDKSQLLGHSNQLIVGASIDHGDVNYGASSEIGTVGSNFVINGLGAIIANSDLHPVALATANTYSGLYFTNTFDLTKQLSLTAGGRFEHWRAFGGVNMTASPALNAAQPGLEHDAFSPKGVIGGVSRSNSSWIGPTNSSRTFSSVAMPTTLPYSSISIARWTRLR